MRYPSLTDGTVTLRAYTLDDLDACVETCADPETAAWTTVPHPYTDDDGIEWITKTVPRGWSDGTSLDFAVEFERRYVGGISLLPKEDGLAEIGFAMHPSVRGRGVCRRAIKLLVDWGFAERDIEVAIAFTYVGNWASRRVLWANGFTFDGMVPSFLTQRGQRRDVWVSTLRATDTREPKSTWFTPPTLETPRLRLRPLLDSDADRLDEMSHDERTIHFNGLIELPGRAYGPAVLLRARERHATGQQLAWCIAARDTDLAVGKIQLFDLEGPDRTEVDCGYVMHPDARGQGYLTEALNALADWTFLPTSSGGLGKRLITIGTAASNTASRHAATRAGFTHVATLPSAMPTGPTTFDDEVIYHRHNPSWQPDGVS